MRVFKVDYFEELPAIHEMVSLTSQSSIGVDLRELIHDKTEKRANVLARDRLRRQAQIIESELIVAMSKSKYQAMMGSISTVDFCFILLV